MLLPQVASVDTNTNLTDAAKAKDEAMVEARGRETTLQQAWHRPATAAGGIGAGECSVQQLSEALGERTQQSTAAVESTQLIRKLEVRLRYHHARLLPAASASRRWLRPRLCRMRWRRRTQGSPTYSRLRM